MAGGLDGKVAIVTGGGSGIGRATAELFASEGARVVVFGRRPEPLADVVDAIRKAGGKALAVAGDVGTEADALRLVETARAQLGGVDALINSAAVRLRAPLTEISAADFAEVLRINLVGAFVLTKTVVPAMRERGGGSIVHIGSALGTVAGDDRHGDRDGRSRVPPSSPEAPYPDRPRRPRQRYRRGLPLPRVGRLPLRHGLDHGRRRRVDRVVSPMDPSTL